MKRLPFRIGTTSYIVPDEILPNVRFLADQVDDVELVLFEIDDGPNNLPDADTIHELQNVARQYSLTYTVHLPLDLRLAEDGEVQHLSMRKARKVIDCTRDLNPRAYILHLEGKEIVQSSDPKALQTWNEQAVKALKIVSTWVKDARLLAVENLEKYPLNFWDEVIHRTQVSRCIDIGHLWWDGHDPIPYLERHLGRANVLHIHGVSDRDHRSLSQVPLEELYRVIRFVWQSGFQGVMTVEVFGQEDFETSMRAIEHVLIRLDEEKVWEKK